MEKSVKEKLMSDIENRLDSYFDEEISEPVATKPTISLEKLKSVVLSIDWEITEKCLTDLISETDALLPHFQHDQLSHTLLRMLRAVGRYIRQHKAQAHPNAIKLVMSVFNGIEQLALSPELGKDQKNAIVAREIKAFKMLKEQVTATSIPKGVPTGMIVPKMESGHVTDSAIQQAMNGLEQRVLARIEALSTQFNTLKKELDDLRNRKS